MALAADNDLYKTKAPAENPLIMFLTLPISL